MQINMKKTMTFKTLNVVLSAMSNLFQAAAWVMCDEPFDMVTFGCMSNSAHEY